MNRLLIFLLVISSSFAQKAPEDGRNNLACGFCKNNLKSLPKEVHFSVKITEQNDVIFELSHASYFDKIWTNPDMGLAIKLVPKSNYNCRELSAKKTEYWMNSLFLKEIKNKKKVVDNKVQINVGKVPVFLQKQDIEGNIAFLNANKICDYIYFIDLAVNNFSLLPMGFYTDEHHYKVEEKQTDSYLIFESKIPFEKNKTDFIETDLAQTLSFIEANKKNITKIVINSFASVEGDFDLNLNLFQNRSKSISSKIKENNVDTFVFEVNASENWEEFYQGIENTEFEYLKSKSESDIKLLLKNKEIQSKLETILKKSRTTNISIFGIRNDYSKAILDFNDAIQQNDIAKAKVLQEYLYASNKNPDEYLKKIEIPVKQEFKDLLNDEIIYKNDLKLLNDSKAVDLLHDLVLKNPDNLKLNYNETAFTLKLWFLNNESKQDEEKVLNMIRNLKSLGINDILYDRMMINFHIIRSFYRNKIEDFKEKDKSVALIAKKYKSLQLNNEDAVELAKFLVFFDLKQDAFNLIESKYNQSTPSENIVFYYLNLLFFESSIQNQSDIIQKAASINLKRFCHLFDSINNGGASFQLLENKNIQTEYCKVCK